MQDLRSISQIEISNHVLFPEIADLLSEGISVALSARGNSMYPFICGGRDQVILRKSVSYHVNDIVLLALENNGYILHRIYEIKGSHVTLMGDGNCFAVEYGRLKDIAGRVEWIVRGGRRIKCDSLREQLAVRLWKWLLPIRKYVLFWLRLCGIGK